MEGLHYALLMRVNADDWARWLPFLVLLGCASSPPHSAEPSSSASAHASATAPIAVTPSTAVDDAATPVAETPSPPDPGRAAPVETARPLAAKPDGGAGAMVTKTVIVGTAVGSSNPIADAQQVVGAKAASSTSCFREQDDPTAVGEITFTLTVAPNGAVSSVTSTVTGAKTAAVACMTNQLAQARFAADPKRPRTTLTFTWRPMRR